LGKGGKVLIFDIEADDLVRDATRIHCIVTKDTSSLDVTSYGPSTIKDGLLALSNADVIVGHNICGYDVPLIRKFYPEWSCRKCIDTLVLSKLYMPEKQSHSLDTYGSFFKRKKPEHKDWSQYSPEMLHRCMEDVEINHMLYEWLMKKEKYEKWEEAIRLEQEVSYYHLYQTLEGVGVDVELAKDTIAKVDVEVDAISNRLMKEVPKRCIKAYSVPINKPFLKSGEYSNAAKSWMGPLVNTVHAPFSRISFEDINLNSHEQVKSFLFTQGWVPTTYNFKREEDGSYTKTSPKLTEDSYDSIKGDLGQLIARRNVLRHRRNTIHNYNDESKGILGLLRDDGRVPSDADTCGTPTSRYTHRGAICNVPGARAVLGKEMRSIFCEKPPYLFFGADLSAIEARVMGHYTYPYDEGEYAKELLDGDIHSKNAELIGRDRDTAKTFLYALMYGAGITKLSTILTCTVREAEVLINNFWEGNKSLTSLIDDLKRYYKMHGHIVGLDGRTLFIRSEHKLLNSLIQSAAAIIFKRWLVLANRKIREANIDAAITISYHDEVDGYCLPKDKEELESILTSTVKKAGEYYNLRVPVGSDVKFGSNWYECH
jgi:DNA polymerase I